MSFLKRSPESRSPFSEFSEISEFSEFSETSGQLIAYTFSGISRKFDFCANLLDYLVKITHIKRYIGSLICCNFASNLHSKQFDKNNLRILTL